jgi:MATE family, multidrug efflux pump
MSGPGAGSGRGAAAAASASILALSAPLVISFWMRAAFTFVDTLYAATIGDAAVAAIGLAMPLEFLMIAFWVGASNSLTSHLSRAMGAGEGARIEQMLQVTWKVIIRVLVPAFLLLAAAVGFFATRMGLAPDLGRQFAIYGSVILGGSALTAFWSILPDSIVKAHHDTRSTMWAGIWSNVINVVLNTIFTFVFHWGIFGIAFSTVVGRFGGLAYALRQAKRHEDARKARGTDVSPALDPSPYRSLLWLAFPSGGAYALMAMESTLINMVLATTPESTAAIAAYSIYYRIFMLAIMPVIAASVAMLPFTARHFGRGDIGAIRRGFREVTLASVGYSVLLVGPACWFGGPVLARLMAEAGTTAAFAGFALRLCPLACLAALPFFLCRPTFEGMQRGRPGLIMAVLRYVVLTAPFAFGGAWCAGWLGRPAFEGLILGLIAATATVSTLFLLWMRAALRVAGLSQPAYDARQGTENAATGLSHS